MLCLICSATRGAVPVVRAGMALAEAVELLREEGLVVVYSSALIRPEMVVVEAPGATEPRLVLAEILRPHGLAVREGPGQHLVIVLAQRAESPTGSIRGRVSVDRQRAALAGVTVRVVGTGLEARVGADGRFEIGAVPPGEHVLRTESSGLLPQSVGEVVVEAGQVTDVRLHLVPASLFLDEIVVTPSHFRMLDEQPESRQFLSREEVEQMPHIADDIYRAVKRLPGAAGGDISATFNVRGGATDEVLVLLDGLELYEPFHLKDFQNIFSTIDAEAVGGVDLLTGGFPVEYGDRLSGVMDIAVAVPSGPPSTSISISTLNARVLSQGSFHDGRGQWLVSARAWYPGALFAAASETVDEVLTDYQDLLAKVEHRIGARSSLAVNVLVAADELGFSTVDEESQEEVRASYRGYHLWANLRTEWTSRLFSQTVLSAGRLTREREGGSVDVEEGRLEVSDQRAFEFVGFKQDWTLEIADRHLLKMGLDVKRQEAEYDYSRTHVPTDPAMAVETLVDLSPEGVSWGMYLGDRLRLGDRVVAELGLRWDRQDWVGEHQLSPRVNLRYAASPQTTVRAAWGRFHQSQRLNELQVEDGVSVFYPAQRAEHWLASLEHRFKSGLALRVEAYHKQLDRLRPRYENLFNPLELFPEAEQDRVRVDAQVGRAQGLELLVKQGLGDRLTWWLSYALARAEDEVDGDMVPRSWDQRNAASLGLNLGLARGWNVYLAGTYHSGWPTTAVTGRVVGEDGGQPVVELTPGPRNRERYPHYHRFDLRASKAWQVGSGEVSLFLEVVNLSNRSNQCCVGGFETVVGDDGSVDVISEPGYWAPIIPSVGLRWVF